MRSSLFILCLALGAAPAHAQETPTTQTTPLVVSTRDPEQPAISATHLLPIWYGGQLPAPVAVRAESMSGIGVVAKGAYFGGTFSGGNSYSTGVRGDGGQQGVLGSCFLRECRGVWGATSSAAGIGVLGEGPTGIVGIALSIPANMDQPVYAGRFFGNVDISEGLNVTGPLTSPVIDQLQARLDALTARLAALEAGPRPVVAGIPVPGRILAAAYNGGGQGVGYFDTTPGNEQGVTVLRNDDVDLRTIEGDEHVVGWFAAREWLAYTVNVTEQGSYALRARVSTPLPGRTFHIEIDDRDVTGPVTAPQMAEWNQFVTLQLGRLPLAPGNHVVKVVMGPEDFMDFHWLEISR